MSRVNRHFLMALGILGALAAVRLLFPSADPPGSLIFWTFDTGHWVHNARNKVLFDQWVMDDFNQGLLSPVFTALTYLSFKTLGPGLAQAQMVSSLLGIATLLVFYYWLQGSWNRQQALLATVLLGAHFMFFWLQPDRRSGEHRYLL